MAETNSFQGARGQNQGHFYVDAAIDAVFPLFGAEAEAKWAPGWHPEWIYPSPEQARAAVPERGWVFKIHGGTHAERIWYVETFSMETHEAVYIVLWPGKMVYRIEVKSEPRGNGTLTTVEYDYRGLSEEGNHLLKKRTADPADFAREMEGWGKQIASCLGKAGNE